ncbi:hypothetical protein HRTV-2_gp108 [Halorubrum virus HRTV-2]|nr:hypothetical protein HRTV-2_gp108 [Halorubrum virus HRTV-2]
MSRTPGVSRRLWPPLETPRPPKLCLNSMTPPSKGRVTTVRERGKGEGRESGVGGRGSGWP